MYKRQVDSLNLAAAGVAADAHGLPEFDPATLQVGNSPIFIAGDANGDRPLMHEAADQGVIAGYNAARPVSYTHLDVYKRQTRKRFSQAAMKAKYISPEKATKTPPMMNMRRRSC